MYFRQRLLQILRRPAAAPALGPGGASDALLLVDGSSGLLLVDGSSFLLLVSA